MMAEADAFVIYDNIQFTKKGWIHRNRFLMNGTDSLFTLPLKKDSDYKNVCERFLADDFDREKLLRQIKELYRKATQFDAAYPVMEQIVQNSSQNLFDYIYASIIAVREYLGISSQLVISSTLPIDHSLKSQDKVIAICKAMDATTYINPIGGLELYDKQTFASNGIDLKFMKTGSIAYPQFGNDFIPHLSILDVMMFNTPAEIHKHLKNFSTVENWNAKEK